MDEQDLDLHMRIKQFLSQNPQFRNPTFDPAPYLIQILKDKSADNQAMKQKQVELIDQENKARELIDQICGEHSEDFLKFLQIPALYAQNLQKLKSNVSVVKKKVRQTKALLLNTQKDIQQIHFNCMFNKQVYKQLKKIQLRLQQYQTAYLALKNNQYYLCALNLPFVEGLSILQSTLAARSQTLRLRMTSKAIDQMNNFLFFSPKVVLPSSNVLLDRMSPQQDSKNSIMPLIANWDQQQAFYKRYKLFKKAYCLDYLNKIWQFSDLDRKQGKIGLMFDIIKGTIRIGKITDISSSIQMYGPKQIINIFLLLKCFRVKQQSEAEKKLMKPKFERWFVDLCRQSTQDHDFISATMNIVGVLFRKKIIIHKIYNDFEQKQFKLQSGIIYKHVLSELNKMIQILYFPNLKQNQNTIQQNSEQRLNQQLRAKLANTQNYINYGKCGYLINQSLKILQRNVIEIELKQFLNDKITKQMSGKGTEMLSGYQQLFYSNFHRDFISSMEQIFCKEGYSFILEPFETIISYKSFNHEQIKYMKGYRSDDRKSIKQFIFVVSFMKALEQYFEQNKLNKDRLKKYLLMSILFFYLKLNYHISYNLIPYGQQLVIEQQRKSDKKLKKKEEQTKRIFDKILPAKQIKIIKTEMVGSRTQTRKVDGSMVISFHTTDKLKVIQRQNHMLLSFSCQFFGFVQEDKNGQNVEEFIKLISKHEPANYDEQILPKLLRVWDTLPDSPKYINQYICAVLYKITHLQCIIQAKIYRQTGNI